jgi:hypothetical protein
MTKKNVRIAGVVMPVIIASGNAGDNCDAAGRGIIARHSK